MISVAIRRASAGVLLCCGSLALFISPASPAFAFTSYPNDYFFATGKQWALAGAPASINAPAAWCVSTGAGITIGHVDTGADFSHPDLAGKLIPGAAFVNADGSISGHGQAAVQDDSGHGTLTAGLLVAATGNRAGIAAVAPDAKALVVKVFNQDGRGYAVDVAAGIRWAVDIGVQVLNLSIGTDTPIVGEAPDHIPRAIDYATSRGVAVAIAAGSSSLPYNESLVNQVKSQALVVNALAPSGEVAYYSRNERGVNIWAPGGDDSQGDDIDHLVISTYWSQTNPGGYAFAEGASFASPQVAGALALLMSKGYKAAEARERILATAPAPNGAPRLDAAKALGAIDLCGARAAAPLGASQPKVTTYQPSRPSSPPPPTPTPQIPPATVVVADSPPNPKAIAPDTPILTVGPWVWLLGAGLAIKLARSARRKI